MSEKENEVAQEIQVADKDCFLQLLVDMVNCECVPSIGITLNVGGFLVSGRLSGGKEYYESIASDFASPFSNSDSYEKIKASLAKHGEIYSSDNNLPSPSYIHLKEAKFCNTNGSPIPHDKGVWWRGRLSEVDGFSLGLLSYSS